MRNWMQEKRASGPQTEYRMGGGGGRERGSLSLPPLALLSDSSSTRPQPPPPPTEELVDSLLCFHRILHTVSLETGWLNTYTGGPVMDRGGEGVAL